MIARNRFRPALLCAFSLAGALCACSGGGSSSPTLSALNAPSVPSTPAPAPSATSAPAPVPSATSVPGSVPTIGSCRVFPADNAWNTDISNYPLNPNSANYMAEMNPHGTTILQPYFSSNPNDGVPINVDTIDPANFTPITFNQYPTHSDPGPYPIPASPAIQPGSDAHMLIVDQYNCKLYETWATSYSSATGWVAGGGAIFDLSSNALRPEYWGSADGAGLPIAAGLVRFAEVQAGAINHAVRFTMSTTFAGHIHPATHDAGTNVVNSPPMGLRLRLKAGFALSSFHGESLVVLKALKRYGMILADNGTDFLITGETNASWNDADLNQIRSVPASAFEVVQTGSVIPN